jgi:TonB family protein
VTTVFVLDFSTVYRGNTELGHAIASELADSLQRQGQGFTVLNASDLKQPLAKHNLREEVLASSALRCFISDLGISILVEATMDPRPAGLVFHISAWMAKDDKSIFSDNTVLPMTASMKDLIAKPIPSPTEFFLKEDYVWNRELRKASEYSLPVLHFPDNQRGSEPECIECPAPQISDEAVKAKFQGTAVVRVRIDSDGIPSQISVVRGLPCGLTRQAVDAVQGWRFKPITGPDGKPAVIEMPVEITFLLY